MTTVNHCYQPHRQQHRKGTGLLFLPFVILWRLVNFVLSVMGRLITAAVGFMLIIIGIVISLTVVGAVVGIPLGLVGTLLLIRAIF